MSCHSSLYAFSVEVWKKSDIVTRNESGQPQADWILLKTISCDFMPARAEERLVGRIQNPLAYNVFAHDDSDIRVDRQLRNLKDSNGTVVESGPFNIIGIRKHMGFSTVEFITISAQKVLD